MFLKKLYVYAYNFHMIIWYFLMIWLSFVLFHRKNIDFLLYFIKSLSFLVIICKFSYILLEFLEICIFSWVNIHIVREILHELMMQVKYFSHASRAWACPAAMDDLGLCLKPLTAPLLSREKLISGSCDQILYFFSCLVGIIVKLGWI